MRCPRMRFSKRRRIRPTPIVQLVESISDLPGGAATMTIRLAVVSILLVACMHGCGGVPLAGRSRGWEEGHSLRKVPLEVQHELTALALCYCTSIDLVGRGNVAAGIEAFRTCFAESAEFDFVFPEAYANWNFQVRGPKAFAEHVAGLYGENGFVRTQHQATNVEVEITGNQTAVIRGYLSATHVLADERVYFATASFVDSAEWIAGRWMIMRRDEVLSALALLPAFPAAAQ